MKKEKLKVFVLMTSNGKVKICFRWTEEEQKLLLSLAGNPEYWRTKPEDWHTKRDINWIKIATHFPKRSRSSVCKKFYKLMDGFKII
jgi:hypothetical protein